MKNNEIFDLLNKSKKKEKQMKDHHEQQQPQNKGQRYDEVIKEIESIN